MSSTTSTQTMSNVSPFSVAIAWETRYPCVRVMSHQIRRPTSNHAHHSIGFSLLLCRSRRSISLYPREFLSRRAGLNPVEGRAYNSACVTPT